MVWKLSMILFAVLLLLDDGFAFERNVTSVWNDSSLTVNVTSDGYLTSFSSSTDNSTMHNETLLSDGNKFGDEVSGNLRFFQPTSELVDVQLTRNQLEFEAYPKECRGGEKILVCYEATGKINNDARVGCGANQCGFFLDFDQNVFWFMTRLLAPASEIKTANVDGAVVAVMQSSSTELKRNGDDYGVGGASCDPKIVDGVVKVNVLQASPSCKVTIKNAKLKPPATTTHVAESDSGDSVSASTFIIVAGTLLGLFIIVVLIVIGIFAYKTKCWRHQPVKAATEKKRDENDAELGETALATTAQSKKTSLIGTGPLPEKEIAKKVSKVHVDNPVEESNEPIAPEHPAPVVKKHRSKRSKSKSSKKKKKRAFAPPCPPPPAVEEPKTKTEDVPPLAVTVERSKAPPQPVKTLSEKTAKSHWPNPLSYVQHNQIQRLLRPGYNPSRQSLSPEKECLKKHGHLVGKSAPRLTNQPHVQYSSGWKKPNVIPQKMFDQREVDLLLMNVGEMFIEVQKMCDEAYVTLLDLGVKFDEDKRPIEISQEARDYLDEYNTLEFIKAFVYGAKKFPTEPTYNEVNKFTLPEAFALAMVPSFSKKIRRHGLSHVRRHMEAAYVCSTDVQRFYGRYPSNALDAVMAKDPSRVPFNYNILTYSNDSLRRQDEADELAPKKSLSREVSKAPTEDKGTAEEINVAATQEDSSSDRRCHRKKKSKKSKSKKKKHH